MWRKYGLPPNYAACELRWRLTHPKKGRFNANAASASGTSSVTAVTHPGAWLAEARTSPERVRPQGSSLNAAAAGATTLPAIVVAVSGRRRGRRLQSVRKQSAARRLASPRACLHPNRSQLDLLPNRRNWAQAETTWFDAAAS
jgi:hypothetical protein